MATTDSLTAGEADLAFHPLKKIEIIVKGERQTFVRDLLDRAGVTGYTLIRDIAGMGHGGFHEGRLLFNDQASLIMFLAVASDTAIKQIAAGMKPLLEKNSGVVFVSDVQVLRLDHFVKAEPAA